MIVCCISTLIFVKQSDRQLAKKEVRVIGMTNLELLASPTSVFFRVPGLMKLIATAKCLLNSRSKARLNLKSNNEASPSSRLLTSRY